MWVALWDDGQLVRVDPARRRVVARIGVGRPQEGPLGVAAGFGAVWVTDYRDGTLLRIDPAADRVVARVPIGPVGSVTSGAGAVWVTSGEGGGAGSGILTRVDPHRNRVAARIRVPGGVQLWDVAAAGRWVWLENVQGTLWRVDVASNRWSSWPGSCTGPAPRWARAACWPGTAWSGPAATWSCCAWTPRRAA